MKTLDPISLGNVELKNRIIRSATYEGRCDSKGTPDDSYYAYYENIARHNAGAIITGFAYTSEEGRAMQYQQAGIESEDKISFFTELTRRIHQYDCPVFMQISHAGRQTTKARAGGRTVSASNSRSLYFRTSPRSLSTEEVYEKIHEYALAAKRAMEAGFDGVQIHAAHGYLVHQFLLPVTNKRKDEFGLDATDKIGTRFLEEIIISARKLCGERFPILVKVSGGIDLKPGFDAGQFTALIKFLDKMKVDGIEISYGTMDHALNIIRGGFPTDLIMRVNPFFRNGKSMWNGVNHLILKYYKYRRHAFSRRYNLQYARRAKSHTNIPIISVGGFRDLHEINDAIEGNQTDIVGLSRPFICEPDLCSKMIKNSSWASRCINCNHCAVMCDSGKPTKCYQY
ncbi:MAG: NADH:flavin oxidoreductase [Bacteroidota bacterium]